MIGRIVSQLMQMGPTNQADYAIAFDLPYLEQQAALKALGEGTEVVIVSNRSDGPTEAERGMVLDAQELYERHLSERETPFPVICGDEKGYGHGV